MTSGTKQMTVRVREELRDSAKVRAIGLKKSLNDYVVYLIEKDLEKAAEEAVETIKGQIALEEEDDNGPG